MDVEVLLDRVRVHSARFLESLDDRRVGAAATGADLRAALGGPLPDSPKDPTEVIDALAEAADAGLVASAGPRYFGFVVGGSLPAATAADQLVSAWDQNAGAWALSPAAAVAEEVAAEWLKDLLGLPVGASVGFTTGCQGANFTGLAAARRELLGRVGWDVDSDGLGDAPPLRVIVGDERHVTIDRALRLLGLGDRNARRVAADDQGRMIAEALADELAASSAPTVVCAQAGNVNSGSFDPLSDVCDLAHEAGAWVHVDGAFGLWAGAAPDRAHLVAGIDRADSWASDAHKWLNVPYDSGLVFCAHPESHRAAMSATASYIEDASGEDEVDRDGTEWVPDFSRRARGFPVYAALRSLGRSGVAELIERNCRQARRFAEGLAEAPEIEILNDVVLNQVLVRFLDAAGDHDGRTARVIARVQADGTCWMGGTSWHGMPAMRISVSNWSTTDADVDRSIAVIKGLAAQ